MRRRSILLGSLACCALVAAGVLAARPPPALAAGNRAADEGGAKSPVPSRIPQLVAALHASRSEHGWRIVLPADQLFGESGETLVEAADPVLATLGELIVETRPREVVVAGHTDGAGSDDENLARSERRARAVAAWLQQHGPKRRPLLIEKGYGRTRPVAPNHKADGSDNPEGRARNRRIEILLRR